MQLKICVQIYDVGATSWWIKRLMGWIFLTLSSCLNIFSVLFHLLILILLQHETKYKKVNNDAGNIII